MKPKKKNYDFLFYILGVAIVAIFVMSLGSTYKQNTKASKMVGSISEIDVPAVPAGVAEDQEGFVSAAAWSSQNSHYADIYESYMKNAENTGHGGVRIKYTEQDPEIQTLYQGMGFAFDYTEAIGHSFSVDDIAETTRPHKLANCLTCKTPNMTAMVNAMGTEVYSKDFDEVFAKVSEPISCYNCHGNTPGTIVITHDYMAEAMTDDIDAGKVDASSVSCAQCHIEYYFDPETKATKVPYSGVEDFTPEEIYEYYEKMGFVDFTNENTGVGMIKVQHPEFETYFGEGGVHKGTFTCADCHMGVAYNNSGDPYANHLITSPLNNEELLKNTCSTCHSDLASEVKAVQDKVTSRETEISKTLVEINTKLADAISNKTLSEDTIEQIKQIDREAQFYWDFVYVENSEGAHNSKLSNACLDKAEALAEEALDLLD